MRLAIRPNWILSGAYNDWWLASDPSGRSGAHIGREYDVQSSYRLNRNLEFGAGLGYIRACEFLVRTNRAHSYTYPYVMLNYKVN